VADEADLGRGLANAIGVEYLELGADHARGRMQVTETVLQPFGIVHGGALAALAESVCSRATYEQVAADGMMALGQSNNTTFLRAIASGHVHIEARARHRGRTTWVWDCEMSDDDGRLCALARLTIAVRPARD
jgi:uncharacterized protein (TIGR00369 family)